VTEESPPNHPNKISRHSCHAAAFETAASYIQTLLTTIDAKACAAVLGKLNAKDSKPTVSSLREKLTAWICADEIAKIVGLSEPLSVFSELSRDAQAPLIDFITQYENLRRPIIGWLFQGKKLRELNARVSLVLSCPDTLDLHKRLSDLKASAKALATISQWLEKKEQSGQEAFVYRLIRDKQTSTKGVSELNAMLAAIVRSSGNSEISTLTIKPSEFTSAEATVDFLVKCCRFLLLWKRIAIEMQALPNLDYVGQKSQIEELHTARMTQEIDRRFLDFVENKKATAKALGGVIKNKQKFPEEQFHHLSSAFPVIIAGIREFAEYFPLKEQIFDCVTIDEASQVSVAQALPALLRRLPTGADGSSRPLRVLCRTQDKQTRPASAGQKETQRNAPRREILSGAPPACVRAPPLRAPNRRGLKRAQLQTLHIAEPESKG
jgi:hypothetical protein